MLCNSSSKADQVITTVILGTVFAYAVPMLLGTADKYFISFLKRNCIDTEFEIDSYEAAEGGEIAVFNTDTERPHYARYVYWLLSFVLLITILLFIFFSVVSDFRDKGLYIVLVIVFSFALIYTLKKLKNFYD
ncbi:hypothetical protein [Entomomonas asaccharolytica]|nr:hypothetical protein [Entomomonas asaccharolytica]